MTSQTTTFNTDRTHLLGAIVLAMMTLLVIGAAPLKLFWLLAIPALMIFWVLKSKTVVDQEGIKAFYAFKKPQQVAWEDFAGVRFGNDVYARTKDDHEFMLPGLSFNKVPELSAASNGRIPDVIEQSREASNDKVVVYNRDGYQVMMTKEEAAAREKAREAASANADNEADLAHEDAEANKADKLPRSEN